MTSFGYFLSTLNVLCSNYSSLAFMVIDVRTKLFINVALSSPGTVSRDYKEKQETLSSHFSFTLPCGK